MQTGIISYGLYLPERFETAEDISKRSGIPPEAIIQLGIERKCIPSEDDQPVAMAAKAAREALQRAEGILLPEDVDVVIWTGEEYKDYIAQTAAIRLQEEVSCRKAWAFDLVAQGVSLIQGLRIASDLIIGDESINAVLLAGGTRNIDLVNYGNPDTIFLLSYSASGAAILLRRDYGANSLVATSFKVDSEMADEVYVPGGGTEIPFSRDTIDSEIMFYQVNRPQIVSEYLSRRWTRALVETARAVLPGERPDYLALRHLSHGDRSFVLEGLGMSTERSAALDRWGHHGANDVVISLDHGIKKGLIQDGSLVAMVSGGIGFTYAACLVQWGSA
jgi:3-oxoacyl-[acyl-carrier-protein] synthase-3